MRVDGWVCTIAQAKRSADQLKERLRESEAAAAGLREAHAAELLQTEEGLSELRGENRLLKANLESMESARASGRRAGMADSADLEDGGQGDSGAASEVRSSHTRRMHAHAALFRFAMFWRLTC